MTGGWSPDPWPGFPALPWDKLLRGSLAVVALLPVQEVPPPTSESSILPPLLHPAPQPFLNLGINDKQKALPARSLRGQVFYSSSGYFKLPTPLIFIFKTLLWYKQYGVGESLGPV